MSNQETDERKFGYYEKRLCVLMFFTSITNALPMLQSLVTLFTPPHRCDVEKLLKANNGVYDAFIDQNQSILNLTIPWVAKDRQVLQSQCSQYNLTLMEAVNSSYNYSDLEIIPCNSFHFDGIEVSAATEFQLVCNRSWMRPVLSSLLFCGMILGSIVAGFLSDRYGRRYVFLSFTFLQFVSLFLMSFVQDIFTYSALSILCGAGNLINFAVAAVIGAEVIPTKYRVRGYLSLHMGFGIGYMLIAPVSYAFRHWRWFLRFVGLLGIGYIPFWWLIDETPQWLLASGKIHDAQKVLDKISRLNNDKPYEIESLRKLAPATALGVRKTFRQVFQSPALIARLSIVCFLWLMVSVSYYALALNNNNLGGDRFLNVFYASFVETFAGVVYYVAIEKWGRCVSYIGTALILAISIALNCFFIEWNDTAVIVSTMLGKLMASSAWAVIYVHTQELFPTKTRQSVILLGNITSKVGGILSPFLIYAGESGEIVVPSLVTSGLIALSALLCFFLPETSNVALPQTVQDAVNLKRKWRIGFRSTSKHQQNKPKMEMNEEISPLNENRHNKLLLEP